MTWAIVIVLLFSALVAFASGVARRNPVWASRQGVASFMGAELEGKTMANGKQFARHRMTCASWHYPLGTMLWVGYDGRHVLVEVTDRGPARHLRREIDLSETAFAILAPLDLGLLENVTVTPIMPPL